MTTKTVHLDRAFLQLSSFANAWAYFGAAVPALLRGITWLTWIGIFFLLGTALMLVLGLHPRTARDRDQPPFVAWSYAAIILCFIPLTGLMGWLTGAIRNTLWLVYFASLLLLDGVTLAAFIRSIRRPPLPTQDPGTQSSQRLPPRSAAGDGIPRRPKSR